MEEFLDAENLRASQLDLSLGGAQLYAEYRRLAGEQAALRRLAALVARGVEPSEVFDAATNEMRRCLNVFIAGLWGYESSGEITMVGAAAEPTALAKWPVGTRTPIDDSTLAAKVLRSGRAGGGGSSGKRAG